MKYISHVTFSFSLFAALAKTFVNYCGGYDYTWPGIAVLWILSSYSAHIYSNKLEKRLRKYEQDF